MTRLWHKEKSLCCSIEWYCSIDLKCWGGKLRPSWKPRKMALSKRAAKRKVGNRKLQPKPIAHWPQAQLAEHAGWVTIVLASGFVITLTLSEQTFALGDSKYLAKSWLGVRINVGVVSSTWRTTPRLALRKFTCNIKTVLAEGVDLGWKSEGWAEADQADQADPMNDLANGRPRKAFAASAASAAPGATHQIFSPSLGHGLIESKSERTPGTAKVSQISACHRLPW